MRRRLDRLAAARRVGCKGGPAAPIRSADRSLYVPEVISTPAFRGRAAMFEHPHQLRLLANWYRDCAELGDEIDRAWRSSIVDFLEMRATEIEESRKARPVAAPDYLYPLGIAAPTPN